MQISIIIPAYNAAKYLNRCIESVAEQDLPYDCYEAIVVNDGSTDETVAILDSLSHEYSFLKYVTVPNAGVSCARNKGIADASGEYLLFLDADDSIFPNVLKTIYQEASSKQLDMMLMNYLFLSANSKCLQLPYHMENNSREVVSGIEFLLASNYPPLLWIYAYRRSFLLESELLMIPIRHEDEEFIPRAVYKAMRIKYYPLLFYTYYQNSDSYMSQYHETDLLNMIAAMRSLNRFRLGLSLDVQAYFCNHIAVIIMRLFKQSIRCGYQNQNCIIEMIKEAGLLPLKPRKGSFYYCLFNISPSLFERYYRIIKRKPKHY